MAFTRAERQQVYIKMAITGPSGSGKTMGALRLAFGLGKKIALIDTENGSGSLYAHVGHYDQQQIAAPFTVQKYVAAIQEAAAAGYDVLIIDSLSHAWAGDGGLLDQKSAKDSRGGNSFSNWADVSKVYEQFKSTLLQSPIHIIGTMRSKQDYVIEQDSRGKSTPRKIGLAPIQREGMEYEFTTVFDVDMTHIAATSKDRTGLFTDEINQITESHGKRLAEWLAGGAAPAPLQKLQPQAGPAARPQSARPVQPQNGQGNSRSPRTDEAVCDECGKTITPGQAAVSTNKFGRALCPVHQTQAAREPAAAPVPAEAAAAAADQPGEDDPWIDAGDLSLEEAQS